PIISVTKEVRDKPVAVFLTPRADAAFARLHEAGVAAFQSPECCADAVRAFLAWRPPRAPVPVRRDLTAVTRALARAKQPSLHPLETRDVFLALGIEHPRQVILVPDVAAVTQAPVRDVVFPAVAKVVSRQIAHKTEAGGVVLDIDSMEELELACRR